MKYQIVKIKREVIASLDGTKEDAEQAVMDYFSSDDENASYAWVYPEIRDIRELTCTCRSEVEGKSYYRDENSNIYIGPFEPEHSDYEAYLEE